jgi:uncharacterized protein (TIGR03437 family)
MTTSVVHWDGAALATTYVSPTQLSALIPAATASGNSLLVVAQYDANPGGMPTFTFSVQHF